MIKYLTMVSTGASTKLFKRIVIVVIRIKKLVYTLNVKIEGINPL